MPELLQHETFVEEILSDPDYVAEGLGSLAIYLSETDPDMSNSGGRPRPGEGGPLPPQQPRTPRKPPAKPRPHP